MPAIAPSSAPGSACITVRIDDPEALFRPHDPADGYGRALDDPIEAYIVRKDAPANLPQPLQRATERDRARACRHHPARPALCRHRPCT